MHISVTDPKFAAMLEAALPKGLQISFLVQCEADRNTLRMGLEKQHVKVQILTHEGSSSEHRHPLPLSALKRFGITSYLSEVVTAPDVVKLVLNDHAKMHMRAIGSAGGNADVLMVVVVLMLKLLLLLLLVLLVLLVLTSLHLMQPPRVKRTSCRKRCAAPTTARRTSSPTPQCTVPAAASTAARLRRV